MGVTWFIAAVIDFLLALINLPGMTEGYWFSWASFGFCVGLGIVCLFRGFDELRSERW